MKLQKQLFFTILSVVGLLVVISAQNLQNCRDRFGNNPWADCPPGCYCNTNQQLPRGYCCGEIVLHGVSFCCIYPNAQVTYPCYYNGTTIRCGYAACGYCGNVQRIVMGECCQDYSSIAYAACLED